MVNNQNQIFNDALNQLVVRNQNDRDLLINKAREIQALVELKTGGGFSLSMDDATKNILIIDICSELLNIPLSATTPIQRKKNYKDIRKVLMKQLNFNKKFDVPGIMLKLCISNKAVEISANKIYEACKHESHDQDLDHPQYATMAVFQACKLQKVAVAKKPFIQASNLKPQQWRQLEKKAEQWVDQIAKASKQEATPRTGSNAETKLETLKRKHETNEREDYDEWAKRVITKAEAEIAAMQRN